jgi:hypothetical protein
VSFLPTKIRLEFCWGSRVYPLEVAFTSGTFGTSFWKLLRGRYSNFFLGGIAILFIVGPDQLVFSGSLLWDPCAAGLKLAFWKNLFGLDLRGNQRSLSDKLFVLSLLALRY